jgi:hypothetical protein
MTMATLMIPVLPCSSLPETLTFYKLLGFDVTHEQTRPNVYAATRRGDVHLHFVGVGPGAAGTCLAILPEIEPLHREFSDRLRQAYGKVPLAGQPRISRMKPGQSRFTVVDVTGNSVIFIRADAPDDYDEGGAATPRTSIGRALATAARLRDFRNDDAMAARVLDLALEKNPGASRVERARALATRAEIACAQGDTALAGTLRAALDQLELTPEERAEVRRELDALAAFDDAFLFKS